MNACSQSYTIKARLLNMLKIPVPVHKLSNSQYYFGLLDGLCYRDIFGSVLFFFFSFILLFFLSEWLKPLLSLWKTSKPCFCNIKILKTKKRGKEGLV